MLDSFLCILAVFSLGLTIWRWAVARAFSFRRRGPAQPSPLPGVTFLKPLKGCNAESRRCLRSWFTQEYDGPVQILLGVACVADPVCAIAEELMAEFPSVDARLVVCAEKLGANAKVSTLRQLEQHIRHPLVMVSDADVDAPPHFAAALAPLLAAPGAGLVNCFYRLANPATLAMQWEAVCINADFWSQVLQARSLGPVDFALGAVMSLPADMLQKIGGFVPLSDYLADDYELGQNVAREGGRIEFADVAVDCREAACDWNEVWRHQLRWARTIRVCRPGSYFLSILGNATLWPLLWLGEARNRVAWSFFLVAVLWRVLSAFDQQRRITRSLKHWPFFWIAPFKDLAELLIWSGAFWGNRVHWRGEPYRVSTGGKLVRA
jgi:ceramide glucosyltransferase